MAMPGQEIKGCNGTTSEAGPGQSTEVCSAKPPLGNPHGWDGVVVGAFLSWSLALSVAMLRGDVA